MPFMKLTSKRQATLPAETCEALGVGPGDFLELEARIEDGERLWVVRTHSARSRRWVGNLAGKVKPVTSHAMRDIRRSIAAGRGKERPR
jgi:bifunctional DNA-binding transcriptional regulator/antitoxin component of YhaV-PrlF toxin-antitoxin module